VSTGVHFVDRISNVGFSHRWLVSLTSGKEFCFFGVLTMHSHVINKEPTNASKYQCISTSVHSYMPSSCSAFTTLDNNLAGSH
jgi:hypothetical protein